MDFFDDLNPTFADQEAFLPEMCDEDYPDEEEDDDCDWREPSHYS